MLYWKNDESWYIYIIISITPKFSVHETKLYIWFLFVLYLDDILLTKTYLFYIHINKLLIL